MKEPDLFEKSLELIDDTCIYFGVDRDKLLSGSRQTEYIIVRQILCYLLYTSYQVRIKNISFLLKRSQGNVRRSINKISGYYLNDPGFFDEIEKIKSL